MSLIKQKFQYSKLSKKETHGQRLYFTPEGDRVASVTTILDTTKDKSGLFAWRKRVGEKNAQEITNEASSRGTRMHKFLETYIDTGDWPKSGSNPFAQQANNMAKIIKENALLHIDEIWGSEVTLWMPKLYAGTTDLVGKYKGNPAIIDFKQSNKPKKLEYVEDYFLQLVAYIEAHNEIYGTKINEGHIFMCTAQFQYQQFDLWPHEYQDWRHEWYNRLYQFYDK